MSEFEEHTALILFTRPIKKSSIFIGKFLASFVVCFAFIALYYAVAATVSMVQSGSIDSNLPESFGLSIAYAFGMVGLSLMISSISKKGSTASILTVVFVILLLPVISQVLLLCNIDASWIFTQASNAISHIFTGSNADVGMSAAVMIAWGVICGTLSYFLFRRRDF